ncbi:MAG: pseudouridine-5'-phosphate glycosidase [Gemmatimonadetes bacterium]|nr:pseudouridine-5'-phosphate glycosidase [Gemmatimonadota bacterium]
MTRRPAAGPIRLTDEVAEALRAGRPVVALETSVLAQGLPIPANREAAVRMDAGVRTGGATPALAAIVDGQPTMGLTDAELERFLAREGIRKVTTRDLGVCVVRGDCGATTVAGTLALLPQSGISVFATGGIGGVHREPMYDESADLVELARTSAIVTCAGAKSILDLPATLERLESLSVPVIGYRTDEFPAFFCRTSGLRVSARVDDVRDVARIYRAHRSLGRREALLVVQPVPEAAALPSGLVDDAVREALAAARADGVRGPSTTPYLLAAVERATGGRTLAANLALLEANARLAGEIAVALSLPDE